MNKIIAVLFAISCFATSAVSNSILGVGMWFWIIIATGVFVTASQFLPALRELGGIVALILSIISVCAVVLTLLASTIGGSSGLGNSEALLVFTFTMIAVFGFSLARISNKIRKYSGD
ncbi:MAG TPA: hypothetical protein DCM64_06090 [Gammaproteobacteria bacterium]|jgi:hypothetical protein|nr:hypothetical protein [Gammaproteobacteria bacterium]MDP6733459.1 hypothetical protein [Gammaproteobacteria bacterium]HAJ76008.1 hypothetical protein [Gammaproteobacteria bacterium]|tara:strand:+ start:2750 stop:3103 length:354 start_codon:yes stop_codon:yes gene_type:complete